jgi:hypothetical protein
MNTQNSNEIKNMKKGRPQFEITTEVIKKAHSLATRGLTEHQIATSIGCCQDTLIEKKKQYSELSEAIKKGKLAGVADVTNALYEKAMSGNVTAMIFFLKNRDPENWKDKHEVKSDDEQIKIIKLKTSW